MRRKSIMLLQLLSSTNGKGAKSLGSGRKSSRSRLGAGSSATDQTVEVKTEPITREKGALDRTKPTSNERSAISRANPHKG